MSYILLNNSKHRIILHLIFHLLEKHTIVDIKFLQNIKKDRMSLFFNLNLSFSLEILIVLIFQIITISIIIISKIQDFLRLY